MAFDLGPQNFTQVTSANRGPSSDGSSQQNAAAAAPNPYMPSGSYGYGGYDVSGMDASKVNAINDAWSKGTLNWTNPLYTGQYGSDPTQGYISALVNGNINRQYVSSPYTPGASNGAGASSGSGGSGTGAGGSVSGTPTAYNYGQTPTNIEELTNYLGDIYFPNAANVGNQALGEMMSSYNKGTGLLDGAYTDKYNGYNQLLDELNAKLNSGYAEMQSYMPGASAAADQANQNLGTLAPLLADQQNAYYDMGRDMDTLRQAYQYVLSGMVPEETKANLEQIYANQMAQASTALNEQHNKDLTNLIDTLGGRGILSSTTSSQAQTGLNENLMRELQNAEYEYGSQKLQQLIDTPYKIFDKAAQLYNSSSGMVDAAGDILNGGLGIQNAYNQNADNYLGLANQANNNYQALINASNSQASYGRSSLDALMNQINAYGNQAGIANNIYTNATNPALDMWSQLLGAETARLTSAQASGGDGGGGNSIFGQIAGAVIPGIADMIFG